MGRRTRKKNKEIIGMDTDSIWYKRNAWWGKQMRKKSTNSVMKKVEEFNRSQKWYRKIKFPSIRKKKTVVWNPIVDDFKGSLFRKVKANSRVEKLFTPIIEDYPREFEQNIIRSAANWHYGHHSLRQVQEAVEEIRHCVQDQCTIWSEIKTGNCSICDSMLTNKFPDDYPDDWKFCCSCKSMAEEIVKGTLPSCFWLNEKPNKILDKITLAGK